MATIKLTITVSKLSNVLSLFDVIKVYRSTVGEAGPYTEITNPATRIPLVAGQTVYVYDDTTGDPTFYYKFAYFNSGTLLESSLSDPIPGNSAALYVSVDDIRSEGVTVATADDDRVLFLLQHWQSFVERVTRQWFVPRAIDWYIDGEGSTLLLFPVPIILVENVFVNDDFTTPLDPSEYRAYTGRGGSDGRDDRKNPKIRLVTGETSIFTNTGPVRSRTNVFEIGEKNQLVRGTFGYIEADGSVPYPIQYAIRKLVVRSASPMAGSFSGGGAGPGGPVIEEETDRHRKKWADPFVGLRMWTTTGDTEVDQILAMYKSPLIVRAPKTVWNRYSGRRSI